MWLPNTVTVLPVLLSKIDECKFREQDPRSSADTCPQPSKVQGTRKVLNTVFGQGERKGGKKSASREENTLLPAPGSEAKVI